MALRRPHAPLAAIAVVVQLALVGSAAAAPPAATSDDWPRQIDSSAGTLILYQPQPESFSGTTLNGRAAFSLTPKGKKDPVFGAMWFTATVNTDRDQRLVQIVRTNVTRIKLPDSTPEQEQALSAAIEQETPKWDLSISLDALTAALAQVQEERAAADELKAAPPKILFATKPTVLVVLDGQPIRRPIEKSGIESVVNTPFPLFYDPRLQRYYLTNGTIWYQASDLLGGPWQVIPTPPREVAEVVTQGEKQDQSAPAPKDTAPPAILVTTEPTELVVTKGAPSFAPITGTELLYVDNTEDNVFRDLASQKIFVVLAGRWYTAASFDGPWTFVRSDQLPVDFTRIPPASTKGDVLAFVSGTSQAKEAVIDAQIPQTAEVRRDAPGPNIQYDGQPNFQPVPGTDLSYAINTSASVLRIQGMFYACVDAVWYVAPSPQGPWAVATSVPQEVQKIPPASPVYNVKYVTIYQTTPQVVYVGYTPGYTGCYAWNGAVVYGTGYYYAPYVSPVVYYPRPITWGFAVNYNPWTGWSYGIGYSAGFLYYGVTWGGAYYRPPWRPVYGGGWYGPGGWRPPPPRPVYGGWYGPGYHPARPGPRPPGARPPYYGGPGYRPVPGLYQRPVNASVVVAPRPINPGNVGRPAPMARPMPNNVYADKNGNVLRQTRDGNWQQRDRSGWKATPAPGPSTRPAQTPAPRPSTGSPGAPAPGGPSAKPAPVPAPGPSTRPPTGQTPGSRPPPSELARPAATPAPGPSARPAPTQPSQRPAPGPSGRPAPPQIQSDYQARQHGNERKQNYQQTYGGGASRPAPRPAPSQPGPSRQPSAPRPSNTKSPKN